MSLFFNLVRSCGGVSKAYLGGSLAMSINSS